MRPSYSQHSSVHGPASSVWRVRGTKWIEDNRRIGSSVASVKLSRIPFNRLVLVSVPGACANAQLETFMAGV